MKQVDRNILNNIIVFAGTSEGRNLCGFLSRYRISVTACVATEYGNASLAGIPSLRIIQGRLSSDDMESVISGSDLIIDATHPYAALVSENISRAAQKCGKPLLRIIRPVSEHGDVIVCDSFDRACEYLNATQGNVFVTTGSKELGSLTRIPGYADRLYLRILPAVSSIEECVRFGFSLSHLICMQGPFSEELNIAMLRQVNASYLVTKESGASGGFQEKLSAAVKCGVKTIVIGRPVEEEGLTYEEICAYLGENLEMKQDDAGGNYPLFAVLRNRTIVFIGAGKVATRRISSLRESGAEITVVAPEIDDEIIRLGGGVRIVRKEYEASDITGAFFAVAATNRREVNQRVFEDARAHNVLVNVADRRDQCDFFFPALFSDGEIVGGIISKNGGDHGLAKQRAADIRKYLTEGRS